MLMWKKLFLFVLLFISLGFGIFNREIITVSANSFDPYFDQSLQTKCVPLDIVLLIDQSSDMAQFDPKNIRISVANWFISVLGYDYLNFCPNEAHRISVISFGHDGKSGGSPIIVKNVELTPLNPKTMVGQNSWEEKREYFASNITPLDLGGRDLVSAFNEAADVLNNSPSNRKQIVIMFAGNAGIPCSSKLKLNTCWQSDYAKKMDSSIFKDINQLLDTKLKFKEETGPYIYILALEGYKDARGYISNLQSEIIDVWNSILTKNAGGIKLFKDDLEMVDEIMNIYQQHNKNDLLETFQTGDIFIDPFMEFMLIYGYRSNKSNPITFRSKQDNAIYALTDVDGDREHFGVITPIKDEKQDNSLFYFFEAPSPGVWEVEMEGSQVRLWRYTKPASGLKILHPKDSLGHYAFNNNTYDPEEPHYLSFALFGVDEARFLKEYENFAALITASVTSPDRTIKKLSFNYDSTKRIFTSNEPLPVDQVGTYSWDIEIAAPFANPSVNRKFLVNKSDGIYDVVEVIPFTFSFIQPSQKIIPLHGKGINAWKVQPLEVSAQLIDLEGSPLSGKDTFVSPIDESVAVVVTHVETEQSQKYLFSFSSYDDSLMNAVVLPEDFKVEGEYLFQIEVVGSPKRLVYQKAPEDVTTFIQRKDNILTSKSTYLTSGGTIIILLFLWLAFLTYLFTDPIKGELYFSSVLSPDPFDNVNLSSNKKRFIKIRKKKILRTTSVIISNFLNEINISKNSDGTINLNVLMEGAFDGDVQRRKRITSLGRVSQYLDPVKGIFVSYNNSHFENEEFDNQIVSSFDHNEDLITVGSEDQDESLDKITDFQNDLVEIKDDNQELIVEENDTYQFNRNVSEETDYNS